MAHLEIDDTYVTLRLAIGEKIAGVMGDLTVARSNVESVEVVETAWKRVHGIRIGTGLPAVFMCGTFGGDGDGETVAVCRSGGPGVVLTLRGTSPRRVVVTVDDPDAVAAQLER